MKIRFNLDSEELFGFRQFSFVADWILPYLPRIGEKLTGDFLMLYIDPHSFYESLVEKEKVDWAESVNERMNSEGLSFTVAVEQTLKGWLDEMFVEVVDLLWCSTDNEITVEIYLVNKL